jgi:hypothetical protein
MSISPDLEDLSFDDEAKRVVRIAFEMTCITLRVRRTDPIAGTVAKRIVERAKDGERNAYRLCDDALDFVRRPPPLAP